MRIVVFSTRPYDRRFLEEINDQFGHDLTFLETPLTESTVPLAAGHEAVCVFVNDTLDSGVITSLQSLGVRLIALRCAGFNNVDLAAAEQAGIAVARVPAYSPHSVAEHTVGMMLTLIRKYHRTHNRVREGNFSLDGLLGFDLHGRTAGIIGTGKIGRETAKILRGFSCRVLACDPYPSDELTSEGVTYVPLDVLFMESESISLHCPLTPETRHIIDRDAIEHMRQGVMLINTSRGALVDTRAVIDALKSGKIGFLGLDVYEEEADLFFEDLSGQVIQDDVFARLMTFPNVLITSHQAFFTHEAMTAIATTTLSNAKAFEDGKLPEENVAGLSLVSK